MALLNLRNLITATRVLAGLFAAVSLGFFGVCVAKIFGDELDTADAVRPGLSVLPLIALIVSIVWNIVALVTRSRVRFYVHVIGDSIASLLLLIFGSTGFFNDNEAYFDNGLWRLYDNDNWLRTEIFAASVLLASLLLQMLVVLLGWFQHRREGKKCLKKCEACGHESGVLPGFKQIGPAFDHKEWMEIGVIEAGVTNNRKSLGTSTTSPYGHNVGKY